MIRMPRMIKMMRMIKMIVMVGIIEMTMGGSAKYNLKKSYWYVWMTTQQQNQLSMAIITNIVARQASLLWKSAPL